MTLPNEVQPSDNPIRARALEPTASFAVAAPAGSGKTGLLTLRVLTLLCRCAEPEDILCITFTRKAASEMRERLLSALLQAESGNESTDKHSRTLNELARQVLERDREQGWELLANPGRLRIQTIDGFCRSLAGQLPVTSALGADLATLDDPGEAYRTAVAQLLDDYARENGGAALQQHLDTLVAYLDNQLGRLENLLVGLLANRDQWLPALMTLHGEQREELEGALVHWGNDLVGKISGTMAPFAGEMLDLARYAAANLATTQPGHPLLAVADLASLPGADDHAIRHHWQPLINWLLTGTGDWRRRVDVKTGFPPGKSKEEKASAQEKKQRFASLLDELQQQAGLLDDLQELAAFPGSRYTQAQWRLLESLAAVLPLLVAHLKLVFRQLGATDFIEVTEAALNALGEEGEPSDLALKLDHRIQHILVDEFQDTSSPQLRLLHRLTEGWQPDDGRTLFVVGDGMQSCYGFRDANVGIFLDIRANGLPSVPVQALDLCVNFRSSAALVNWVNGVFRDAFPGADDVSRGAVRYADSEAFYDQERGHGVTCSAFVDSADHRPEACFVADRIAQLRRDRREDSIAVLVRSRSHLLDVIGALRARDVPFQAIDIDPLLSRMAIVDLLSLTRALLDPSDRIAWLSILRAPWCGLDMYDLHALVNADLQDTNPVPSGEKWADIWGQIQAFDRLGHLSQAGRNALSRLRSTLGHTLAHRRRKPLRQWVEGAWLALGGPAAVRSEAELADVQTFLALLEQHDRAGIIADWRRFRDALARLYAQPESGPDNPVQLLTIHKSKGLEFDHVFLPGLARPTRGEDSPLLLWHERLNAEHKKQLILSPITAADEERADPLYRFLQREKKIRSRLEDTRLLYVACTRARKQLFLTASLQSGKKAGTLKAPGDNTLLAKIWPRVEDDFEHRVGEVTASDTATQSLPTGWIRRLPQDWHAPVPAFETPFDSWRTANGTAPERTTTTPQPHSRVARYAGTLWHRLLRRLVLDGLDVWSSERVDRQRPFWRAQAAQLGLQVTDVEPLIERIAATVATLADDQQARWLFGHHHHDSQCELPLIGGDGRQRLVVDRTFVDNGVRWIIDYKTSEPGPGEPLETFLREERRSYATQLTRYAQAFAAMEDLPVRLALYFPYLLHLEEL